MNTKTFIKYYSLTFTAKLAQTPFGGNTFTWNCALKTGLRSFEFEYTMGGAYLRAKPYRPQPNSSDIRYGDYAKLVARLGSIYYNAERDVFNSWWGKSFTIFEDAIARAFLEPTPPTIEQVLECLASDYSVLNYKDFPEWANEFGYDDDSITAERIYQGCLKNALGLRHLLGVDGVETLTQVVSWEDGETDEKIN